MLRIWLMEFSYRLSVYGCRFQLCKNYLKMKKEYTELEVCIESRKLVNLIYENSKAFPKEEIFGLTNQMRRSAVSVPSNIAEGLGRKSANEAIHFLHLSRGSLYELETQCYLSFDQNYISEDNLDILLAQILSCKKLLNGFINYFKTLNNPTTDNQ